MMLSDEEVVTIISLVSDLLTPGAAEAIAVIGYRLSRTANRTAVEALRD